MPIGGYAESDTPDFFGPWSYSASLGGYSAEVQLQGGGTLSLGTRERPKVYVEDGVATLLFNGVRGPDGTVSTFVQEIIP